MKTLTALTAIAALVAGISIASAASMDKNSTMGRSSASVTGTGKFCIKGAAGALNCQYASLSACKKIVKGSETCEARPSSTTGSKY
ncbi:MAG TPA: hypothetical protein VMG39_04720 [Pseudolabrys sp.]|nr:hypothetical protein [Pseudolabrys sp.]